MVKLKKKIYTEDDISVAVEDMKMEIEKLKKEKEYLIESNEILKRFSCSVDVDGILIFDDFNGEEIITISNYISINENELAKMILSLLNNKYQKHIQRFSIKSDENGLFDVYEYNEKIDFIPSFESEFDANRLINWLNNNMLVEL